MNVPMSRTPLAIAPAFALTCTLALVLAAAPARAQSGPAPLPDHLVGDVGAAVYSTGTAIRGESATTRLLPYGYFDYQRLFARIDTVGVKTVPFAQGWLELAARIAFDGYDTNTAALRGLGKREHPALLGLGTYQRTPYGGLFLNAFHDFGKSGGNLLEAVYAARFAFGGVTLYPQLGIEHRSRASVQYYYGVSAQESAASGSLAPYSPGSATQPLLALMTEVRLADRWNLNLYLKRRFLARSVTDSPVVDRRAQDTAFLALSYRFD
jgi:outer membrane protein